MAMAMRRIRKFRPAAFVVWLSVREALTCR